MSNKTKMSARARIDALVDAGSFVEIGEQVTKRNTDFTLSEKEAPGDGVITGYGVIGDKLVFVYSQDADVLGGSIGEMHAMKIATICNMADRAGAPVIGLNDCTGFRIEEGLDALDAFGVVYQKIAASDVYQIQAILGSCGGGMAIASNMADITLMDRTNGELFINSPNAITGNFKEKCNTASADFQAAAGNVDIVCDSEKEVIDKIRELITILPVGATDTAPNSDDKNRTLSGAPGYGIEAIEAIADGGRVIELKADYGKDIVTALTTLDGTTVGVVANTEDGVLSTKGCLKTAEFVDFCDYHGLPVITLANVKEYASSKDEERTIAKAVSEMVRSYTSFSGTSLTVITGEAYGSAYLAMNSIHLAHADTVFALKGAKIATMDAKYVGKVLGGGDSAKETEITEEFMARSDNASEAARRGYVDSIIEPKELRKHLIYALQIWE